MSDDELTIEITQDDVVTILDITHEYLELISKGCASASIEEDKRKRIQGDVSAIKIFLNAVPELLLELKQSVQERDARIEELESALRDIKRRAEEA